MNTVILHVGSTLSAGVRTDLRCVACFSAAVLRRSPYGRSAVYSLEATEVRSAVDSLGCVVLWRGDVFGRVGGGGGWGRIENLECVYSVCTAASGSVELDLRVSMQRLCVGASLLSGASRRPMGDGGRWSADGDAPQGRMVEGLGCICGYVRYVRHFDSDCGVLVHLRRDPAPPGPAHSTPRALRCHRTRSRKNRRRSQEEQSGQQDEQRDHAVAGCSGVSSGRVGVDFCSSTVGDDKPHFWEHMRSRAILLRPVAWRSRRP